ncbi:MAG: putative oxidoreductase, partial [Alphaproteobacteria bacterium]|nr:putative oxidoreductase [Alphaproteobacteria bacterium]
SIKLVAVTAAGAVFGPPGYETDLLYLACLAALVAGGSGPLAIGGDIANRRSGLTSATQSRPGVASPASPSLQPVSPGRDTRGARMLSMMAQTRQQLF